MDEAQFLALPEEQRKAMQRQLQAQGLYAGKIDGKSGEGTRAALTAAKQAQATAAGTQVKGQEIELERFRIEQEAKKREAEEARRASEAAAAAEREKNTNPLMDTFVPFAAGAGVGGLYGELTNRGLDKYERGNAQALREISDELGPTRKLTNSQMNRSRAAGAAAAAERFNPTSPVRQGMSTLGRALSYGIPAGVVFNEYQNYQGRAEDSNLTEKERKANQQIANGLLGVTTGIGVEGGRRFFFPTREPGLGKAEMRIQTARDLARRFDENDAKPKASPLARVLEAEAASPAPRAATPALAAPEAAAASTAIPDKTSTPGSHAYMKDQAKSLGIKGASTMNKTALAKAVADAMTEHGGKRTVAKRITDVASKTAKSGVLAPVAAGAMAYDAMRSPSVADDGSLAEPASMGEAAAVGAGAAGATAAVPYAAGKLPGALMRTLGRVAGPAAAGLTAYDIANMAVDENAKPNQMLEGATTGAMPQAPGNEKFFALQQALARQAYGR